MEADNQARMNRLLEWEKGRARVESASVTAFLAQALEVYHYETRTSMHIAPRVFSRLHEL